MRASWGREWFVRCSGVFRRAAESDTVLLVFKGTVAATVAWVVAEAVLGASSATFAPFSAVLMVHATVSRALNNALRFGAAMLGGVVLAGLLSPLFGPGWWTFAVLVLLALVVGRWRGLGAYGPQVAVAAMFAYSSLVQPTEGRFSWVVVASIAGMVLLGCAIAIVVNYVLVPPLRYRPAQQGVGTLSRQLTALLCEIADSLHSEESADRQTGSWYERAEPLPGHAVEVRASVEDAAESLRFNPRKWLLRQSSFNGYRVITHGLQRIAEQMRLVISDLSYINDEDQEAQQSELLRPTADVLAATADITSLLGTVHSVQDLDRLHSIELALGRARECCQQVAEQVDLTRRSQPGEWLSCEALHTDLRRLVEEGTQTHADLARLRPSRHSSDKPYAAS